jgi:hypothetical protein
MRSRNLVNEELMAHCRGAVVPKTNKETRRQRKMFYVKGF